MLYHVSPVQGIKQLQPHSSTHGKAWVYAIRDRTTGLLFGVKQDDFDFCISVENDVPVLRECYPGALEACYAGKACSVYEVEEEGFLNGQTDWEPEMVNPSPVGVAREEYVPDLLTELQREERNGHLVIVRYTDTAAYRQMISAHIVDRLVRFNCIHTKDERLVRNYGAILALLQKAISGDCLVNEHENHQL